MIRRIPIVFSCLMLATTSALSQSGGTSSEKITVSSLLGQDYVIAGTLSVPSGGAGLFMRKDKMLYFCFATETPQSAKVSTKYCKPVE